jgi:fermentation-respiration switch protein FrsA (DUF1100 family)
MISEAMNQFFNLVCKTAMVGLILLLVILVALYFFQNKMIYMPDQPYRYPNMNPQGYRDPSELSLDYEEVKINTSDNIKLHGWFVKHANYKQVPTVIYFHENAGNIGTRLQYIKYYTQLHPTNVILVAYRGYSYSTGIPTEAGLKIDALAVLDHVFSRDDIDKTKIFVHGRSLGGAAGIDAVSNSKHKIAGLILENTFTSMGDMVDRVFPKLAFFKTLILKNHWLSGDSISKITCPILFIMSLKDELVPVEHMLQLYEKAVNAEFKEKHDIPDGGHNDNWALDYREYFGAIRKFMQKCNKSQ